MMIFPQSAHRQKRGGTVTVLMAVCLTVMIGVLAIALDGGLLQNERRHAQATADAAALAAAADLYTNYPTNQGVDVNGTAKQAALNLAKANGYSNDGVTSTVTVHIPPISGSYAGKAGYAEVVVQFQQQRGFSTIYGSGTIPVSFRAVAHGNPNSVGVLILDPLSTDTCEVDGKLNIIGEGDIIVNSSDAAAVSIFDLGNITARAINVVGDPGVQNNVGPGAVNATVNTGIKPVADPLAGIPEPVPTGTNYGDVTCSGNYTLQPGIYSSITVMPNANVTMQPGIYYFSSNGLSWGLGGLFGWGGWGPSTGLTMHSDATLTGNGVMIYNQSGDNLNFWSSGTVTLTPPTTGTYKGISIFQPRSDATEMHIVSQSNITITGTLYAAQGLFDLRPMGSSVFNMGNYICWQFESGQAGTDFGVGGGTTGTVNLKPSGGAPTQRIRLVE